MKKNTILWLICLSGLFYTDLYAKHKVYDMTHFGLFPNTKINASPLIQKALDSIKSKMPTREKIILRFSPGRYDFYEENSTQREYYISNHDQDNPKKIGIALENMQNIKLDGQGSEFIFHGRMLPISLIHSSNCQLENFSIDFENPHIAQIKIVSNNPEEGIIFETAPWVHYRIRRKNQKVGISDKRHILFYQRYRRDYSPIVKSSSMERRETYSGHNYSYAHMAAPNTGHFPFS